jgi:hypothetical protein
MRFLCFFQIFISIKDYRNHPCRRDCNTTNKTMVCEYDFKVEWYSTLSKACFQCPYNKSDCERPDCIAANGVERALMAVNRMMPGPAIEVCQNDLISVYVHNNLRMSESTSIHWHGITQKGTPYYDGVGMITQCSIQPHTTFLYKYVYVYIDNKVLGMIVYAKSNINSGVCWLTFQVFLLILAFLLMIQ